MSAAARIARKTILAVTAFAFCIFLGGCVFEAPITTTATRKVDPRLLGEWAPKGGGGKVMTVGRLDELTYIVLTDSLFFRAHHSDVAQTAFVSAQYLDGEAQRYLYMTWTLSENGTQLELRNVKGGNWQGKNGPIPSEVSKNSTLVQKFLIENLQNPDLFEADTLQFTKAK